MAGSEASSLSIARLIERECTTVIYNMTRPGGERRVAESEEVEVAERRRGEAGVSTPKEQKTNSPTLPHRKKINDKIQKQVIEASSFIVIRFQASNPGLWFWHCHIEWHLADGLALVVSTTA